MKAFNIVEMRKTNFKATRQGLAVSSVENNAHKQIALQI